MPKPDLSFRNWMSRPRQDAAILQSAIRLEDGDGSCSYYDPDRRGCRGTHHCSRTRTAQLHNLLCQGRRREGIPRQSAVARRKNGCSTSRDSGWHICLVCRSGGQYHRLVSGPEITLGDCPRRPIYRETIQARARLRSSLKFVPASLADWERAEVVQVFLDFCNARTRPVGAKQSFVRNSASLGKYFNRLFGGMPLMSR